MRYYRLQLLLIAALLAGINLHLAQLRNSEYEIAQATMQPVNGQPYTTVPVPRNDADGWTQHHADLVAQAKQGGCSTLFLGDSITEGMPQTLLDSEFGAATCHFGIVSDSTQHLLWRLQNGELDFPANDQPKVVAILIGTNNLWTRTRLTPAQRHDVFLGVKANVDEVRKRLPNAKILVIGILPRAESAKNSIRAEIDDINNQLATLADGQNVFYTDVGASLKEPDGSIKHDTMHDYLHPSNPDGYTRMFDALKPAIQQLQR
jgi:lysophospholipase L1-like esterase